jgi:hypothetical protein
VMYSMWIPTDDAILCTLRMRCIPCGYQLMLPAMYAKNAMYSLPAGAAVA